MIFPKRERETRGDVAVLGLVSSLDIPAYAKSPLLMLCCTRDKEISRPRDKLW